MTLPWYVLYLDYIFFAYGLAFLLLGVACAAVVRKSELFPTLLYLGLFGFLHGSQEWVEYSLVAFYSKNFTLELLSFVLLFSSFLALCEFVRLNSSYSGYNWQFRVAYGILIPIGLYVFLNESVFARNIVRYFFALPGALSGSFVLFRKFRSSQNASITILAIALACYGIASGFIVSSDPNFFPASIINSESFADMFGFPIQLVRTICGVIMVASVFMFDEFETSKVGLIPIKATLNKIILVIVVVFEILVGAFGAYYLQVEKDVLYLGFIKHTGSYILNSMSSLSLSDFSSRRDVNDNAYTSHAERVVSNVIKQTRLEGLPDPFPLSISVVDAEDDKATEHAKLKIGDVNYCEISDFITNQSSQMNHTKSGSVYYKKKPCFYFVSPLSISSSSNLVSKISENKNSRFLVVMFAYGSSYEESSKVLRFRVILGVFVLVIATVMLYFSKKREAEAMYRVLISEAQFKALTDAAYDGIIVLDQSGKIAFWNSAAEYLFGWSKDEVMWREINAILYLEPIGKTRKRHFIDLSNYVEDGSGRVLRFNTSTKDGYEIPIELSIASVKLIKGIFFVAIIREITDRLYAERELEEMNKQLGHQVEVAKCLASEAQIANAAKSQFLANMSHEIRTPMNGILGMTRLVLESELSSEQRQFLQIVESCGKSLLSIIDDILDLSKIEAGHLTLTEKPFDIRDFVGDIVSLLESKARERNITVVTDIANDVPSVLIGDDLRIRQVLTNLIGNAIKFTPDGGGVALQVRSDTVISGLTPSDSVDEVGFVNLHITVSDSGIGIKKESLDEIFEAFSQADGSHTREFGGTGLGLAITKKLVTAMGGKVWVSSLVDVGSVFHVILRLKVGKSQDAISNTCSTLEIVKDYTNKRVILAEDDFANQRLATVLLKRRGCDVILCKNGEEVVSYFLNLKLEVGDSSSGVDLILMDSNMPLIDGMEATRRIRRIEQERSLRRTPIVAATAAALVGDKERCCEAGMDDYLTKPFDFEKLEAVLAKFCTAG